MHLIHCHTNSAHCQQQERYAIGLLSEAAPKIKGRKDSLRRFSHWWIQIYSASHWMIIYLSISQYTFSNEN